MLNGSTCPCMCLTLDRARANGSVPCPVLFGPQHHFSLYPLPKSSHSSIVGITVLRGCSTLLFSWTRVHLPWSGVAASMPPFGGCLAGRRFVLKFIPLNALPTRTRARTRCSCRLARDAFHPLPRTSNTFHSPLRSSPFLFLALSARTVPS